MSIESTLIFKIEVDAKINIETFDGDELDLTSDNFKRTIDKDLLKLIKPLNGANSTPSP